MSMQTRWMLLGLAAFCFGILLGAVLIWAGPP
jgi:hypothetical protein